MKKQLYLLALGLVLGIVLAACGGNSDTGSMNMGGATATATSDTGSMNMGGTATADPNAPFDAKFIDGMISHHQGAIEMAKEAQTKAEHAEIKTLANNIIADQQKEITKLQNWRKDWYPNLAPTTGTGMDMGDMKISEDASKPFDLRFMDAMTSHHQGAIEMAKDAQTKAEHQDIKDLAAAIITAQTNEINDMKQWKKQWYNVES
jgi:uncharacterized protein (DUF305 family)